MPISQIEPIEPDLWFDRAAGLLARFKATGRGDDLESAVRRAYHLVQLTPRPLRPLLSPAIDETAFEKLLDCGALESAAMGLIGPPGGILVSRKYGARKFEAIVWLQEDNGRAVSAMHDHAAGAIVGALFECLVNLRSVVLDLRPANDHEPTRQRRHTLQSEQRPPKTQH